MQITQAFFHDAHDLFQAEEALGKQILVIWRTAGLPSGFFLFGRQKSTEGDKMLLDIAGHTCQSDPAPSKLLP